MCVIAVIPKGAPVPSMSKFNDMWRANPDGAGFMYPHNKALVIRKGFMSFNAFRDAWKDAHADLVDDAGDHPIAKVDICVHFRIGTHGGHIPEMTHPHRIGEENAHIALAHNGIIRAFCKTTPGAKSDSAYFADYLATFPPMWWKYQGIVTLVETSLGTGNKVVVFTRYGQAIILNEKQGDWIEKVWYSNSHWITRGALSFEGDGTGGIGGSASRLFQPQTYIGTERVRPDGADLSPSDDYYLVDAFLPRNSCRIACKIDNGRIIRQLRVVPHQLRDLIAKGKVQLALRKGAPSLAALTEQAEENMNAMIEEEKAKRDDEPVIRPTDATSVFSVD